MQAIEQNPECSVEENLQKVIDGMGLDPQNVAEIKEAFKVLDAIQEKSLDLEEKKKEGVTRVGWLQGQMSEIAPNDDKDGEIIISQIENGVQSALDNTLLQEI